jgi:hypothetical protein
MVKRLFLLVLSLILLSGGLSAQRTFEERENIGNGLLFSISLGFQEPGGDMADRFGANSNLGGGLEFITEKSNFIFGLEGGFLFGSRVKEDVIANLRMPDGEIVGGDGVFSSVALRQRGFFAGAKFGKIFRLSKSNPRDGLKITVGAGLLQHKIRIQDDSRQVNQLDGDYKKGYDRLTNGLALQQFIGYQLLSKNRLVNFYAGLEFTQGFTESRRDWNFDTMTADTERRFDMLIGVRLGWILPFYFGGDVSDSYYY